MNSIKIIYISFTLLFSGAIISCNDHPEDEHTDHISEISKGIADSSADAHEGEWIIELTEAETRNAGIKTITAELGSVPESRRLYGEIRLNEERVIHKYPKYAGVVRDVSVNIGDYVQAGDTLAVVFNTSTLGLYSVVSAQSGEVLEKHAVVGEYVDGSEPILVVGDLSVVWVDLHAFEKDMPLIQKGQPLTLHPIEGSESIKTTIRYIKPVMESDTRTNIVRCIIDNRERHWNPGRLVYGEVSTSNRGEKTLIVPETSLQSVDEKEVVFIPGHAGEFIVVPVQTGRRGAGLVEVVSGLDESEVIVTEGSFFLKSELVTSSLSGHAGHGH